MSVRLKLTLSYAGFLMLAGALLLAAVWLFLLRYVPNQAVLRVPDPETIHGLFPIRSNLLHEFLPKALATLAFLLVFGLVGGWFLAGRMLAPLARITDATRIAGNGSLGHRINLNGRHDEFRELADSFDAMLARLEAHVGEQRRFAANASHELRTPLAITQTMLEVARNDPDRDNEKLIDGLAAMNTRAIDLTEALLMLSRANQQLVERQEVDLSLVAEEVAETLLPLAEATGVSVTVAGDASVVSGSPALLLQLVSNLVHNAIVHNCESGAVRIATSVSAKTSVLVVENSGELLPIENVERLVEPFLRGTERVHTHQAGVGLGLAIAKSIVDAHDGTLTLVPRPEGGLRVEVRFQSAQRN